jgi:superfamily II DNA or RNA helicase/HKD family nuclease
LNILHATTDPTLLDRLKHMLASAQSADIAVGYFYASGFNAVVEDLARLDRVRLLVGRTDRGTIEDVARHLQQQEALRQRVEADEIVRKSKRPEVAAEEVEAIATGVAQMPQTAESQADVRTLRDFIATGRIEIRTYVKSRLHAKAYLCWYDPKHAEPGSAIVGSSNFTLAGFTGNTELNVRVTGDAEMDELKRWFDALWAESVDVTQDIAEELDRSWALAQTPPYHVYLKALYELYGDQVAAPELEPGKRGGPELANFQIDAVRKALGIIDLHGGVFIGDVVGLGKTYIGAELLRQLQYTEKYPPLIICPAGLVPMWERTNEQFALGAEVVSMSIIAPPAGLLFDEDAAEYIADDTPADGIVLEERYPNRGAVLVDEVHNFRNGGTRRYRALQHYLDSGEHRAVLLSATPQNLGPKDIYFQLRLFLDDLNHGLPLEPLHLEEYFGAVQKWYAYRLDLENWQIEVEVWERDRLVKGAKKTPRPEPPVEPSVPLAKIEDVLNPTFIRRRRRDIKELYGDLIEIAGKPAVFPEPRLENPEYNLDKVYAKAGSFDALKDLLAKHQGARYLALKYLNDDAKDDPAYRDLMRAGERVAGLMKHLLYKRLESSVAAFRSTLGVLMRSNRNFRKALDEGFVPIGQTATRLLGGEDFDPDELLEVLQAEEEQRVASRARRSKLVHAVKDFDADKWRDELDADYEILKDVHDRIVAILPEDDDKLQVLRQFLARKDVAGGKVIIFSEAQTTVEYLYEQLNPGGKDQTIAMASGGAKSGMQQIVKRFAPKANLRPNEKLAEKQIQILITTDVLSEGQNLQDCNRVVNYDLHWNPVRFIQRFGRVDRIGTEHSEIYIHNMWPDTNVDKELDLTQRLLRRIQSFHDFIGLDAQLLSDKERLNPNAMYRIYVEKQLDEDDGDGGILDEVASFQRGIALLQKLEQEDPDLWATITNLPDGIRSAIRSRVVDAETTERSRFIQRAMEIDGAQIPLTTVQQGAGVRNPFEDPQPGESVALFKTGDHVGTYAMGSDRRTRSISAGQLLASVECEPGEPMARPPDDTNERVMAAYGQYREDYASRLGRARRPGRDTQLRRYLSKQLRLAHEAAEGDADEQRRIDVLTRIFLDHIHSNVQNELAEVRKMQLAGHALVIRLEALRQRFKLNPPEAEDEELDASAIEVTRIVCSDGLVARD